MNRVVGFWLAVALASAATGAAAGEGAGAEEKEGAGLGVGQAMADFGLRQLDLPSGKLGKMVWLSDFVGPKARQPKRLLLLNFYATWCKPCTAELPHLVEWQRRYGARGLQVLSINYRSEGESWEQAVKASRALLLDVAPPYPVLFDKYTNRNQLLYMGRKGALPCNILIGGDGTIVARYQGGASDDMAAIERAIRERLGAETEALKPEATR